MIAWWSRTTKEISSGSRSSIRCARARHEQHQIDRDHLSLLDRIGLLVCDERYINHKVCQMLMRPTLMSFDVFGTLISVRDSSYGAFERILADAGAHRVDVKAFWEYWEHRNIAHYWEPYRSYREICELSLQ